MIIKINECALFQINSKCLMETPPQPREPGQDKDQEAQERPPQPHLQPRDQVMVKTGTWTTFVQFVLTSSARLTSPDVVIPSVTIALSKL